MFEMADKGRSTMVAILTVVRGKKQRCSLQVTTVSIRQGGKVAWD